MDAIEAIIKHKFVAIVLAASLLVFYLWQPISDIAMGTFNKNLTLQVEADVSSTSFDPQLVTIQVKPFNAGKVPIKLFSKNGDSFKLEVREISVGKYGQWVDPNKLPLVGQIDLLRNYKDGYIIEQNSAFDEVENIYLKKGTYLIHAVLEFSKDFFVDQLAIIEVHAKNSES